MNGQNGGESPELEEQQTIPEDDFFLVDDGVNGIYRLTVEELKSDKYRAFLDALIEELRNEKDTKETYE